VLTDDELYGIFGDRRRGARIIFISDSCHSGSVSRAHSDALGMEEEAPSAVQKVRFMAPEVYLRGDELLLERARKVEKARLFSRIRAASLLLSGCKDDEYSYDAWFNGRANGAFTFVALMALKRLPADAVYQDWYRAIRRFLPHVRYPQTPQISGSWHQRKRWRVFES
jgi:hypothetical protein